MICKACKQKVYGKKIEKGSGMCKVCYNTALMERLNSEHQTSLTWFQKLLEKMKG